MIEGLREKLVEQKAVRAQLLKQKKQAEKDFADATELYQDLEQGRIYVQMAAEQTQEKISVHISSLGTMALASVFPDPYELALRFVPRRKKTEADLLFVKGENECDPLEGSGGGAVDVANFALRPAVWAIKKDKRPVMILDEPFRHLSVDLQMKCSAMLKQLSSKMNIQIIMISHLPNIIASADKIFKITYVRGTSILEEE